MNFINPNSPENSLNAPQPLSPEQQWAAGARLPVRQHAVHNTYGVIRACFPDLFQPQTPQITPEIAPQQPDGVSEPTGHRRFAPEVQAPQSAEAIQRALRRLVDAAYNPQPQVEENYDAQEAA